MGFPSSHFPLEVPQHQPACAFRTIPGHPSLPENGIAFVPLENRDTARDIDMILLHLMHAFEKHRPFVFYLRTALH